MSQEWSLYSHACDPSTGREKQGDRELIQGSPQIHSLQSKFKVRLGYVRFFLKEHRNKEDEEEEEEGEGVKERGEGKGKHYFILSHFLGV